MDAEGLNAIKVGFQAFTEEGGEECGAVRHVVPEGRPEIVVYIENAGEFVVPLEAIRGAHDDKVILDPAKLDQRMRDAIAHAHDQEEPGL